MTCDNLSLELNEDCYMAWETSKDVLRTAPVLAMCDPEQLLTLNMAGSAKVSEWHLIRAWAKTKGSLCIAVRTWSTSSRPWSQSWRLLELGGVFSITISTCRAIATPCRARCEIEKWGHSIEDFSCSLHCVGPCATTPFAHPPIQLWVLVQKAFPGGYRPPHIDSLRKLTNPGNTWPGGLWSFRNLILRWNTQ